LQDPNPDPRRLQFTSLCLVPGKPETVDGVGTDGSEFDFGCAGDINSLSFSSEAGQFRLDMSVSASPGMYVALSLEALLLISIYR
jgi:hypothetical protein